MEERELTRLLQQLGDRVTPGPPPLRRIVNEGEALRGRRSGRVRMYAVAAAAAAAVVGGGTLAATVIDLPSMTASSEDSAGGNAENAGGAGGGEEMAPEAAPGRGGDDEGATAADAADTVLTVVPQVVAPGETVEVASQADVSGFGQAWRLERLTGDTWTWEYTLVWAGGNRAPTWWPAADERSVEDSLIPYTAPFPLVIPPEAAPGDYRVCQNDGSRDLCGLLTVTE